MSERSRYDEVARQIANNILATIKEIEKKNNPSFKGGGKICC
jgi:hypothetical protein